MTSLNKKITNKIITKFVKIFPIIIEIENQEGIQKLFKNRESSFDKYLKISTLLTISIDTRTYNFFKSYVSKLFWLVDVYKNKNNKRYFKNINSFKPITPSSFYENVYMNIADDLNKFYFNY